MVLMVLMPARIWNSQSNKRRSRSDLAVGRYWKGEFKVLAWAAQSTAMPVNPLLHWLPTRIGSPHVSTTADC